LLLGLAAAGAALTIVVYQPDTSEARTPPPARSSTVPAQLLVEEPMEPPEPEAVEPEPEVEEPPPARPKRAKRRRLIPEGTIEPRRVVAFMRGKMPRLRQCYERRLRQNNMLRGTLVPQIRIHPSGSVMNVSFSQDTLHDRDVRNCVARLLRSWQFPLPEGGAVTVANPLRFEPVNE
jgi:hypothetical protein